MEVKNHSSNTIRHESSNIPCGNEGQAICEQHDFLIRQACVVLHLPQEVLYGIEALGIAEPHHGKKTLSKVV